MPAEPSASSEPISGARSDAHNLAETNVDVRVDTVKSGMSTSAGQPAGSANRDLPGWVGFVGCSTTVVVSGVPAQPATGESGKA
jgi:hypothetical protein